MRRQHSTPRRAARKREIVVRPVRGVSRRCRNPQLMLISNPASVATMQRTSVKRKNPAVSPATLAKTVKAFKKFHMSDPTHGFERNVPDGWPTAYIVIGEVEKFCVEDASGKRHTKSYRGKRPIVATTAGMKKLFIFGSTGLGFPSGRAVQIDYKVPADSGRNKWAPRWYHPHDSRPSVKVARGGRAAVVQGRGMKINRRGIIG